MKALWRGISLFLIIAIAVAFAVAMFATPEQKQSVESELSRHIPQLRSMLGQKSEVPVDTALRIAGFEPGQPALIRIYKQSSELEVWIKRQGKFELFRVYPICKWSGQLGPKLKEGDGQSPEGFYEVTAKQLNPNSRYHLAFNIGYPNAFDTSQSRTGSALMVHGSCLSIGCYAMTDAGIEDIYGIVEKALSAGQVSVPVHIFPFRMTAENLANNLSSPWLSFWKNLAEGDALFQKTKQAADVWACDGRYYFDKPPANCRKVVGW